MEQKKEFYQICGINATAQDFTNEGYKVINFGMVKNTLLDILKDEQTAINYHNWNQFIEPNNAEMINIQKELQSVVFKESRGNSQSMAIGWENGESYLRYHSGIIYKWFK